MSAPKCNAAGMLNAGMRTEWEKAHFLKLRDLTFADRFFAVRNIRYWHVVGYLGALAKPPSKPLDLFDTALERVSLPNRIA